MMRRVALHVSAVEGGLAVVCNDGSVWTLSFGGQWKRQPDIPQSHEEGDE